MEFEFTGSLFIEENDLEKMCELCRKGYTPRKAFNEVVNGWDNCDYAMAGLIEDDVIKELENRLILSSWPENIKDLNRGEIIPGDKIKFKGSDHIFLCVEYVNENWDGAIIDLIDNVCYDLDSIFQWGLPGALEWYTKESDDDFFGVELVERKGE